MMSSTLMLATNAESTRNENDVGDKYIINGAVFLFYFQISLIHKRTLPNVTPDIQPNLTIKVLLSKLKEIDFPIL